MLLAFVSSPKNQIEDRVIFHDQLGWLMLR